MYAPIQVDTVQCTRRPRTPSKATWGATCLWTRLLLSGPSVRRSTLPGPYRWLSGGFSWKYQTVFLSLLFQANHGGGYQYRLCPKGQPLTEVFSTSSLTSSSISPDQKYPPFPIIPIQECFQKLPLPFTGLQGFHWGDGVKVGFICTLLLAVIDLWW